MFLALVLMLASCDGEVDSPQIPDPDFPSFDIPVIDVPAGDVTSIEIDIQEFSDSYSTEKAEASGVYIVDSIYPSQAILPAYRGKYEADYQAIGDYYYGIRRNLMNMRQQGQISNEQYYEKLDEMKKESDLTYFKFDTAWQSSNCWTPFTVVVRISNTSTEDHTFRYVIYKAPVCYFSEPVTVKANSEDIYILEINTGGKYMEAFFTGCTIEDIPVST